jgi:RimJ/RimL family protein N-acetyltransferase
MKGLATSRLRLRRYRETDAAFLFDMYQRPEVLRFLSDARLADLTAASDVVRERQQLDSDPVLGWWMVTLADGARTGTILLVYSRGTTDIEIGWHQHPDHDGHGYTTEAAHAVLDHAFDSGVESVIALTTAVNSPSQAVCRRLGMHDLGMTDRYYDGAPLRLFQTTSV